MASSRRPVAAGAGSGSAAPSTSQPEAGEPTQAKDALRPVEAVNGGHPTRVPADRGQGSTQRQAAPTTARLPVGRANPPPAVRRGSHKRHDARTRIVQGRRTRRVVRKIDVWTVLKMSFLFYLCVLLVFLVAGVVLWNIAQAFNVIHSVEKFMRSVFDLQKFTFHPTVVLQSAALGGGILVLLATGANVLAALLYNLISDVVGGVQFIVLEETAPPE